MKLSFLLASLSWMCVLSTLEGLNVRGFMNGDFIIGALLPITESPDCKKVNRDGIQLVETIIYGVRFLNEQRILPKNATVGFDIRDTCSVARIALKHAVELSRNGPRNNCGKDVGACKRGKLVAILGPEALEGIILTGSVLGFANIIQLVFTPSTRLLSNPSHYSTLKSLAPSISDESSALVSVVRRFHWSCVNVIGSDDLYGREATTTLKRELTANNICISTDELIKIKNDRDSLKNVHLSVERIKAKPRITVTLLLVPKQTAKLLFDEAKKQNLTAHVWIGSEASGMSRDDVIKGYHDVIKGSLGVHAPQAQLKDFRTHLEASLKGATYCDWLKKLRGSNDSCQTSGYHGDKDVIEPRKLSCDKHIYVMNGVFSVAHALKNLITGSKTVLNITSVELAQVYKTLPYTSGRKLLESARQQSKKRTLSIFHRREKDTISVGNWTKTGQTEHLHFNDSLLEWPGSSKHMAPFSDCSKRCPPGTFMKYGPLGCLWDCVQCPEGTMSSNFSSRMCKPCPEGKIPNKKYTRCLLKEYQYLQHFEAMGIVILTGGIVGEILTIAVLIFFLRFQQTPVVKASNMEFSLLTLVLLIVWFMTPMLFIGRPNDLTCKARTILIPILYTSVSAFLLTKTKRLIQIFSAFSKNMFLSNYWYSFVAGSFIFVQVILCGVYLFYFPPETIQVQVGTNAVLIHCSRDLPLEISSFSYNCVLAGLCASFAFKSRNLPETYSEAKHICFTMCAYMISWVIYFVGYYGNTSGNLKSALPSLAILLGAYAVLFFIFLPKIRVIVFEPEKNTKKAALEGTRKYSIDVTNLQYYQGSTRERRHTLAALPTYQGPSSAVSTPQLRHLGSLVIRNPGSCLVASIRESEEDVDALSRSASIDMNHVTEMYSNGSVKHALRIPGDLA